MSCSFLSDKPHVLIMITTSGSQLLQETPAATILWPCRRGKALGLCGLISTTHGIVSVIFNRFRKLTALAPPPQITALRPVTESSLNDAPIPCAFSGRFQQRRPLRRTGIEYLRVMSASRHSRFVREQLDRQKLPVLGIPVSPGYESHMT